MGIIIMTKRIRWAVIFLALVGLPWISACNSTPGGGGTETGSATPPINISALATHLETVADALVPEVSDTEEGALVQAGLITFGASDQWDQYLDGNNITVLTDVFGEGDESGVVTRIRVLMNQFSATMEGIFSQDPEISCEGADVLEGGDSLDIAFYGAIPNGTAEDRYFDCVFVQPQDDPNDHYTTLYGEDADNIIRIVFMFDVTNANEWWPEERGNILQNLQVVYATYAETEEEGSTVGYLDLQYAQASIYSGLDDDLTAADDNILFKSRTRITGRVALDESGEATDGVGDFAVTKYDRNVDGETVSTTVTKTIGRGDYSAEGYSLLSIDSDMSSLAGDAGTFCIQMPAEETGVPAHAEEANCSAYETAYAWGSTEFPFTVTDEIESNFEEKEFFEGDDTDLIGNSGDNFSIPSY